jgi:DNA-directed RNA polymerase subunit L
MEIEPQISNIFEENNILKFTLSNVDVSLANAIRRIILSEIPTFVFKTSPHSENNCNIYVNTTRFNNEIVKQRLSCIPIHIDDMDFPYNDYILELDEKNDTDTIRIVTTEHFKIKNISSGKYLTKESINKIFPSDTISNYYIDFVRLRPKISDDIDGEHIKLDCKITIGTAKEGTFNVVSCCSYGNTPDNIKINEEWNKKEKQIKTNNITNDELDFIKKDWIALDSNRYFIKNSYDFIIETIGVFDNITIFKKACNIMIDKFNKLMNDINSNIDKHIIQLNATMLNGYEIILENEDYTLGKALEYLLYTMYYEQNDVFNFCGFRKPHPHINISIIRLGFNNLNDYNSKASVFQLIVNCCNVGINTYTKLLDLI